MTYSLSAHGAGAHPARELVRDGHLQIDVLIDGEGPAILLLPSSQRDSLDFDDIAARIAANGFRVLRPQPRGMGRTTRPAEALDLNVLGADVALVISRLGGSRAIVAGHAFGHFVARVADLNHPRLVRGVVVIAGAARIFPAELSDALDTASDVTQPRAARIAGLQRAFFAPGHDPSAWLDGWHPELREAYRRAGSNPPKAAWWPVSNSPVLDLQAADDPWRPAVTRNELKDVLGDKVTVRVIEHASHALIPEQPAAVAEAIVAWARSLPL